MSNEDNGQKETVPNEPNETTSSEFVVTLRNTMPIVHDSLGVINDSVEAVKKYKIARLTFDLADAGARKVSGLAKPVLSGHIEKADKIAAASVQRLGSQFPFFKEPTDKIINSLKEPAFNTISTVKQYHEQLDRTIENNITTPGSRFVMSVDSQLAPLVNAIEGLLQKVIPDENGETNNRDIQNDQQQQTAQTVRVLQIALATRNRCVEKVKKQLSTTQTYTTEQLKQLQDSSQLLGKATETVNTLVVNLRETVQNPNLQTRLQNITSVIFKDEDNLPEAVQARIAEYSSALLATTNSISDYVKSNASNFPDYLQDHIKPLLTFFEQRYGDIVNEIKNGKGNPIEMARQIIQFTTSHTLPLLKTSQEAIHCYMSSLNTSFNNHFSNASQILNVK